MDGYFLKSEFNYRIWRCAKSEKNQITNQEYKNNEIEDEKQENLFLLHNPKC